MAIKNFYRSASGGGDDKLEMTLKKFKKWLKKFDADKDGRISQEELRDAIRSTGVWFSTFKSKDGLKSADKDQDGFIGDDEIDNLKEFALKRLGVRIVT